MLRVVCGVACHGMRHGMCQYFDNGWMWEGDKKTGALAVKDANGETVTWIENAGIRDIETVQAAMEKMLVGA